MLSTLFIAIASLAVNAQTIGDLVRQRAQALGRVAAAASANPQWDSPGNYTLIVPTADALNRDSNLGTNTLGTVFLNQAIDYLNTQQYQVLTDANGVVRVLWDNYTPGQTNAEIHIRDGLKDGIVTDWARGTNGWLYVINVAFSSPQPVTATLPAWSLNRFNQLIEQAGLKDFVDRLQDTSVFAPTDAAFAAVESRLTGLSQSQLQAIVYYHVWPRLRYSVALNPGSVDSALPNNPHQLTLGSEAVVIDGQARVTLADIMTSAGIMHRIDHVLIPTNLPGPNDNVTPTGVTLMQGGVTSVPTASPTSTATGSVPTVQAPPPLSTNNGGESILSNLLTGAVALLSALTAL